MKNSVFLHISLPFDTKMLDEEIRVFYKGRLIWGMVFENPEKKEVLEYRNIKVPRDEQNLEVVCKYDFTTKKTDTMEFTEAQQNYDTKYNVVNEENLFFGKLGNIVSPKKILVTFPEFMQSTSDISYPISAISSFLKNKCIMEEFVILAFQDRYFFSGSYMCFDNEGDELKKKFESVLLKYMRHYSIKEENIVFFGASKGGTVAINYFENFASAKLIVSVPQISIIEYARLNRPLKNVILPLLYGKIADDAENKVIKYLNQGRNVTYLYSNNDVNSNFSFIEKIDPKYKIKCLASQLEHDQVTSNNLGYIEDEICTYEQKSVIVRAIGGHSIQIANIVTGDHPQLFVSFAGNLKVFKRAYFTVNTGNVVRQVALEIDFKRGILYSPIDSIVPSRDFIIKGEPFISLIDKENNEYNCLIYLNQEVLTITELAALFDYEILSYEFPYYANNSIYELGIRENDINGKKEINIVFGNNMNEFCQAQLLLGHKVLVYVMKMVTT